MSGRVLGACQMRETAWDALRTLHYEMTPKTVAFDGLAYALSLIRPSTTSVMQPGAICASVSGVASLAGVHWDITQGLDNEVAQGGSITQCRTRADGCLTFEHTNLSQTKEAASISGSISGLCSSPPPETERILCRRALYARAMNDRVQWALEMNLLADYGLPSLLVNQLLDRIVSGSYVSGRGPCPIDAARHLLRDEVLPDGPDGPDGRDGRDFLLAASVFDAAPLALLALVVDNGASVDQRVFKAEAIIARSERCNAFTAPDDSRFNVMERFLALSNHVMPRLCKKASKDINTQPNEETNTQPSDSSIQAVTLRVCRLLAEACMRQAPGYIDPSCRLTLTGVSPDGPLRPWTGVLLDLGLYHAPNAMSQTHLAERMLACVADVAAHADPDDGPLKAAALLAQWHMRPCFSVIGHEAALDALAGRVTSSVRPSASFAPQFADRLFVDWHLTAPELKVVAPAMWQYAERLAATGTPLINPAIARMLELSLSGLPASTPAATTRVLDTLLAMDWHAWATGNNANHAERADIASHESLFHHDANAGLARLCCRVLPKVALSPEHVSRLNALTALFIGDRAAEVEVRVHLTDARLRIAAETAADVTESMDGAAFTSLPNPPNVPSL